MKTLGGEGSFDFSSVRENAVENEEPQRSCGPTKILSFKNKTQRLSKTGVNTCTASRGKGNADCGNCAAPQAMSPQKLTQLLSHAGADMLDALTSAKIFRLLLPSVPSLQPLFHKVVAVAERDELFGDSAIPIGSPLFEALPPAVFFVGFEAAKVYHAAFKLRNKDRISRRVLAVTPDSLHFSVTAMKEEKASTAVAPGMSTYFLVTFRAGDKKTYACDLHLETERETFLVPLRAFQGLCSLNIPPVVSLETAIVGKRKEKTMFLTNNGNADSNVTLLVSPPFEVQPGCFPIPIGGSQQVVFSVKSCRCGTFDTPLKIKYDDGREEMKQLECKVVEGAVTLSMFLLKFGTTFVNLTSERSLCIENNSNEHLPFRWSFGTSEERLEESDEIFETVSSGSFAIKPASGRVWANSTQHIRVQFTPIQATTYNSTATLNIIGREKSLKLQLCGTGTGPQAKFTKAELDFGDVVVYTNKTLDVEIVNTGDIAATYLVKPLVGLFPAGTEINFIPSGGCISINKAERVQISLKPAFVGEFEVVVPWAIESSPEDILLKLKGRAIPPQINCDVPCVDFGIIPFGFEEVRSVALENTSGATQTVNAKVIKRTDDTYCDIKISPEVLAIPAGALGSFNVILCPSKAQTYLEEVAFGLPGLIEDYFTLPLRGSSKTPHVALEPESSLVLEDVFIHTAATKSFTIRNTSRLSAQFTVTLEGGEHVSARASPSKGLVPPLSEVSVLIIFYPTAPGDVNFNCLVHIAGLDTPFQLGVNACASGPKLKIEPKELQWGKIKCLEEVIQQVDVTNTSPIPASIRCCIRSKHGYFTAKNPEMTLNGGTSAAILIGAMFREAVVTTGQLTVSAVDGQSFIVYLKGQAVGSPVVLEDFGPCTDFQQVCTSNAKRKTFKVFNRGSRMRHIHFLDGSRSAYSRQTPESQRKFTVEPNEFPLGPDSSMEVVIEALSTFPGRASQVIICQESLGAGTTPVRVARTLATADFFTPNLVATPSSLSFKHVWRLENETDILRQSITISNNSPILLRCKGKATHPFDVEPKMFSLGPQESSQVTVSFDTYHNGRHSSRTKGSLEISSKEHPRIDVVSLEAETEFPNIELEENVLDFGFIVNETTKRIPLRMRNTSGVPVTYSWFLTDAYSIDDLKCAENNEPVESEGSSISIHKVFDFAPFTGSIEPGASETVNVRYWGLPNHEVSAVALCSVSHGPEYPVRLIGRASFPRLRVSQTEFDFGEVPYLKPVTAEVNLMNGGYVDLSFAVDMGRVTRPWSIEVPKREGLIRANEKMKLEVKFIAGIPDEVIEQVFVEVDHCDPIAVTLRARGTYRCLLMGLPRAPDDSDSDKLDQNACTSVEIATALPTWQQAAEIDRQSLCKIMLEYYNRATMSTSRCNSGQCTVDLLDIPSTGENDKRTVKQTSSSSLCSATISNFRLTGEERAFAATPGKYVLDFGSVVVGQSKTRVVQLRNASSQAYGVKINKKDLSGTGFCVEPEVINRLQPKEKTTITVTAKRDKEEDANVPLTAFVSGNLSYQIILKAKFVVPDLSLSADTLDFQSIKRGFRKTVTLRLRNEKSVPAQWRYRDTVDKGDKAQREALRCFRVEPKQSVVEPGQWIDLKVHFSPEKAGDEVCARLIFCIEDNPKWKCVVARGAPALPCLEFVPSLVDFGYSLPMHTLRQEVILRNNSDEPYEIFSLEFDDLYRQTNALLREFDGFDESGITLLPVRPPGKPCWSRVRRAAMRKALNAATNRRESDGTLTKIETPNSARGGLQGITREPETEQSQQLEISSDESDYEAPQGFPYRVLPPCRQSAIILGPISSGKRHVAAYIGGEMRKQLTLDECVDWALSAAGKKNKLRGAGAENASVIEEMIKLLEVQEGDGEATGGRRNNKARPGKADRRAEGTNPGLPLHCLTAAVKLRVAQPDCFAGTVFRVEPSSYCPSIADGAVSIARGLSNEDIMVVIVKFGQPAMSHREGESAHNLVADGVAFYRGLLMKQLQREREIMEQLDCGQGSASASTSDSRRKRPPSASEGENSQLPLHVTDELTESLKQEYHVLQQSRQRIEAYLSSTRAAQSFVQDQISAYSSAENEMLKEAKNEVEESSAPASSCSNSRRGSRKSSLGAPSRVITFSSGYVSSALPIESLLGQLQLLREPIIPNEPPIPVPDIQEVVHYPPRSLEVEPPSKLLLLTPLPSSAQEKSEEDEVRNKSRRARDSGQSTNARSKSKQDRGGEEDGLLARLAVEPGFMKVARWILQPQSEQRFLLKCFVDEEGEFACTLHFSVVGDPEIFRLETKATCSVPRLLNFPEGLFERSVQERPADCGLKKTYISDEGVFDWGELLSGRSTANVKSLYSKVIPAEEINIMQIPPELLDFMTSLTLKNGSPFTTTVKGSFAGGTNTDGVEAMRSRRPPKGQAGDLAFSLFPSEVTLPPNGTACMHLWCLPKYEGEVADKLILSVSDNHQPLEVKLLSRCIAPKICLQTDSVAFGRILAGHTAKRRILIENPTGFAVRWSFSIQEIPIKCFSFDPEQGGTLEPYSSQPLDISYEASLKASTAQCRLTFKCSDAEGIANSSEVKFLAISAEPFCIDAGIELPSKTRILDFGKVQAYQEAEIPYTIFNRGKYSIRFDVSVSSPTLRSLLTLSPQRGDIRPGEQRTCVARLSCPHEVELTGTEELAVSIQDSDSGWQLEPPIQPLQVMALVAFNEISLSPPRGLNFGPVESGKTSALPVVLENKGRFTFEWFLANQDCIFTAPEEPTRGAEAVQKGEKPKQGKPQKSQGKTPEKFPGATFGPFRVVPVRGQLEPGTKALIQVEYNAQGDESHLLNLALLVNGVKVDQGGNVSVSSIGPIAAFFADPFSPIDFDAYGPIKPAATYFIQGQSSIPSISLEPEQLFHEQEVVSTMDEAYAIWKKRSGTIFVEEENSLCFGPVICGLPGSTSGVVEAIRIDNPQLIPAEIVFEIKQAAKGLHEKNQVTLDDCPFDVEPKRIIVAPHDYAYVMLSFKPTALQQYSCCLRIAVEKSANSLSGQAQFDLRGEGTLPSITFSFPASVAQRDAKPKSHLPHFDFGRVAVHRTVAIPVLFKNEGVVPATARLLLPKCDFVDFTMPHSLTLMPKEERTFSLAYRPQTPGDWEYKFRISTYANPFENVDIHLKGAAFTEELIWSAVPPPNQGDPNTNDGELLDGNHLMLKEVPLGETAAQILSLRNLSTQAISFELNAESLGQLKDVLVLAPAIGTLAPNEACDVSIAFRTEEALSVSRHAITFSTSYAQCLQSSMTAPKPAPKAKGKGKSKQSEARIDGATVGKEDPAHPEELLLYISAASDFRQCELSVSRIDFEDTSLLKSRVFFFMVNNTSAVSLPYELFFERDSQRDDPCFYKLAPSRGCIPGGGQQQVQITFSPKDITDFSRNLVCEFPNFLHGSSRVSVPVYATAIRPICHIEIPPTDYFERRPQNATLALDDNVAVVEIEGIGVGVRHIRRIYVHNPTANDVDFECEPAHSPDQIAATPRAEDSPMQPMQPFKCMTRRGRILAGRKTELIFEYSATQPGVSERLWAFSIPSRQLVQMLLLVGRTTEPRVAFEVSRIIFPPTMTGRLVQETIILRNQESIPITFQFDRAHLKDTGSELKIMPLSGSVGPESSTVIKVQLCFTEQKNISVSIPCRIAQKFRTLRLDIKGEGYCLVPFVKLVDKEAERPLQGTSERFDFGCVLAGQTKQVILRIGNNGKYDFSFKWITKDQKKGDSPRRITIQPAAGFVQKGQVFDCTATFIPDASTTLQSLQAICDVQGKTICSLLLVGSSTVPKVSFSFTTHDFGILFTPDTMDAHFDAMPLAPRISSRAVLKITNTDAHHECSISSSFSPTPIFDFKPVQFRLSPEEVIEVPITFSPREAKLYQAKIPFFVNDQPAAMIQVFGRGTSIRMEAQGTDNGVVKLQPVLRGKGSRQVIRIINHSKKPLSFYLKSPDGQLSANGVSWRPHSSPSSMIKLLPKQSISAEILFRPTAACKEFQLPLVADCQIESVHGPQTVPVFLCKISGKCFEAELRLRPPSVAFGQVVVGSWVSRDVLLSNIGELPMTFRFSNLDAYLGLITISPSQGTLQPQADLPVTVTFRPTKATEELEIKDILCFGNAISNLKEPATEVARMQFPVTGQGICLPPDAIHVVKFATSVRSPVTKTFYLKNTKKVEWTATPTISVESPRDINYFSFQPCGTVTIPPQQRVALQLTYHPLTMTADSSSSPDQLLTKPTSHSLPALHSASIFCALPAGEACCIRMIGTATEPTVEQTVEIVAACKQQTIVNIKIRNWLGSRQTFNATYTILQPTGGHGLQVQAPTFLDVPGGQIREYRFSVSALKPCNSVVRFQFTNPSTGDFTLADARIQFNEGGSMGTINFNGNTRQLYRHRLDIENPSSKRASIQCTSTHQEISFLPQSFAVAPQTTSTVDILMRPTVPGSGEASVLLTSEELGLFKYLVKYEMKNPGVEKRITFSAPLGRDSQQYVRFMHFGKKATLYQISLEFPAEYSLPQRPANAPDMFILESKVMQLPADIDGQGIEICVPVKFVPSRLQDTKAILCVRGAEGQEYKALLVGRATAPEAQGPIKVPKGKGLLIEFKNPLDTATEFAAQVDQPAFSLDKKSFRLEPRRSTTLTVATKTEAKATGRLIISADALPAWVIYLKTD